MIKAFTIGFSAAVAVCTVVAALIAGHVWLLNLVFMDYGLTAAISSMIAVYAGVVGTVCAAVASRG